MIHTDRVTRRFGLPLRQVESVACHADGHVARLNNHEAYLNGANPFEPPDRLDGMMAVT